MRREMCHKTAAKSRIYLMDGGRSWIRTSEGVSQQIYSLPPLATWVSYQPRNRARINAKTHHPVTQLTPYFRSFCPTLKPMRLDSIVRRLPAQAASGGKLGFAPFQLRIF